jgi:L-amino acid N-acyltransferase YncA
VNRDAGTGVERVGGSPDPIVIRAAGKQDAAVIARIYNEGIEDRRATFQAKAVGDDHFDHAIAAGGEYPLLVAERDGRVVAWGAVKPYSDFPPYRPVVEAMLYVARTERGRGLGTRMLNALADVCEHAGFTKLTGKIFADNEASVALVWRCGFREVGVHHRHGRLDGRWKDVLVVERLLGEAAS